MPEVEIPVYRLVGEAKSLIDASEYMRGQLELIENVVGPQFISYREALVEARDLLSEQIRDPEGEANTEYARGIVDLIANVWGRQDVDTEQRMVEVARELELPLWAAGLKPKHTLAENDEAVGTMAQLMLDSAWTSAELHEAIEDAVELIEVNPQAARAAALVKETP